MVKTSWIILIIIGLLLISGIGLGVYYYEPKKEAITGECVGGSTILSISNAVVTTSSNMDGKEVIRVTAVANEGAECLTITWDSSEIERKLKDSGQDYKVDESVYGSLITNSQTQTFTSSQKSGTIYKVSKGEKQTGTLCTIENCEKDYPNTIDAFRCFIGTTCWCVHENLDRKSVV